MKRLTVKDVIKGLDFIEQRRRLYVDMFEIAELAKTDPKKAHDKLRKNDNICLFKFIEIVKEDDKLTSAQLRTLLLG